MFSFEGESMVFTISTMSSYEEIIDFYDFQITAEAFGVSLLFEDNL